MTPPVVPFPREIRLGTVGKDVIAHKRALSRWDPSIYPWQQFSSYAGPYFINAITVFKDRHGLGTAPKIGGRAHTALVNTHRHNHPDEWAFDSLAIALANEYEKSLTSPEDRIRNAIVAAAHYWFAHRWSIAYSQARPFEMCIPPIIPQRWDCSAFAINTYYAAHAPDPSGWGYKGIGYTGNLIDHGAKVSSVHFLKPGDLIFYGHSREMLGFKEGDPTHVAVYVGEDMVISNGSHPMRYASYTYRSDINQYRHYDMGV